MGGEMGKVSIFLFLVWVHESEWEEGFSEEANKLSLECAELIFLLNRAEIHKDVTWAVLTREKCES